MSHNAGGPSGPNVPPPPGQGPGGSYGGPQGPGGPGAPGGPGQPYGDGAPQKKSKTGLIAGIAGGIALILVLCCVGGFLLTRDDDDDPTSSSTSAATSETSSETSSDTSSESPTSSETSESPAESETSSDTGSGSEISLPDEFDGWKKVDTSASAPAGAQVGAYTKGTEALSIVTMAESPGVMDGIESLWSDEEDVDGASCGKYTGQTQCVKVEDGNIILITHGGDAEKTAGYLDDFINSL